MHLFIDLLISYLLHWNVNLKAETLAYSPLYFWGLVQCREWNSFQMHK